MVTFGKRYENDLRGNLENNFSIRSTRVSIEYEQLLLKELVLICPY